MPAGQQLQQTDKLKMIMNKFLKSTVAAAFTLVAMVAVPAFALDTPVNGFGVGSTNGATTLSWAIVSARSANNGTPAVSYINATSDKSTSKVQFYKVTAQAVAQLTNSTTTLYVRGTNGFASGDAVVIRHIADDSYEKRTLTSNSASTNLVVTAAPLGAVTQGDIIYKVVTTGAGSIPCGSATITPSGTYLYVGQQGKPLLVELDATTSGTLNVVGGVYLP